MIRMPLLLITLLAVALSTAAVPPARGDDYIWIEGEAAKTKDVRGHSWYDGIKKQMLSGGAQLSNWNQRKPGEASYEFEAPAANDYTL